MTAPSGLVVAKNPFDAGDVTVRTLATVRSIAEIASAEGLNPRRQPVIARLDGRYVLQKRWDEVTAGPGQHLELQALPRGGRTGLLVALQVALTIAALVVAGPAAAAITGATSGVIFTATSALVSAAIMVGGTMLINALVPPAAAPGQIGAASPTYTLAARGNSARLEQPIPVLYGQHIIYPDYAATPWWVYADNDQYLHCLLVVGQGHYQIDATRIGSAPIASFAEITTQVVTPGQSVTLFDPNVYTASEVSGQSLKSGTQLKVGEDGWVGPFPAAPPDAVTDQVGVDLVCPRGLYTPGPGDLNPRSITARVEARRIDSNGIVLDVDWTLLAEVTLTAYSSTPVRRSYTYALPSTSRWEVRVKRVDTFEPNAQVANEVVWGGLRGYLDGPTTFGDLTVVAMKMRATDNLNSQTARQVNMLVTRKLPVWDGTSWSAPAATRSIAWAAADILRNSTYGAGLADARFDLAKLLALDAVWATRGDACDIVFDSPGTVFEALSKVLRCGRARPFYQAGIVRFHRDAPQTIPRQIFTEANTVAGSFQMSFALPVDGEAADGVTAKYLDARTWLPASVTSGVGGASPSTPAIEQLTGITGEAQALREAAYMAAANRYRRAFVQFQTELEGRIPSMGDLVLVAHDNPRWGLSGYVTGWDAATRTLTVSGDVDITAGGPWYVRLRDAKGAPSSAIAVTQGAARDRLVLATAPPFTPTAGGLREPTHFSLGSAASAAREVIVSQIVPRGSKVEVLGVIEDARVHVN